MAASANRSGRLVPCSLVGILDGLDDGKDVKAFIVLTAFMTGTFLTWLFITAVRLFFRSDK